MIRLFVVLLASLFAASCAEVRSNVTVNHMMPAGGAGKTVAIMPYESSLAMGPDYQGNVAKLAAHLQAKGYSVAPSGSQTADYIAFFHYGVNGSTLVNPYWSVPAPPTGSIITYGWHGPFSNSLHRLYTRTVILEIVDRARFRANDPATYVSARVYSGWVKSEGACATIAPVIDPMLTSLFAEFPGQSTALRTVELPSDNACGPYRYG